MSWTTRAAIAAGVWALAACASLTGSAPDGTTASAELRTADGAAIGTALLTQVGDGVRVVIEVRGLPAGPKAMHIHEVGRCDPPRFTSAGDHFNPDRREHGLQNPRGPHAGDLPNLTVADDGIGRLETTTPRVTLGRGASSVISGTGRALVIHSGPDDHRTDPTGNSGARLACGVILKK